MPVGHVAPASSKVMPRWRSWVVLLATLLVVAVTARLGAWQLGRAAQKEDMQQALDSRRLLPALSESSLPRVAAAAALAHYRPVVLSGHWLAQHTVYLENRQMNGRPGFYVITPLQLLGEQDAVLVQRGWAPRDMQERSRIPSVIATAGIAQVDGHMAPPPARLYEFAAVDSGAIRQNLDIEAFSRETGVPLRPFSVLQADASGSAGDGLLRQWPRPAMDVHKHYGYAFQWFALSALTAGLYVWFQLVRPRLWRRA